MRIFWRYDDINAATITASNTASGYKASNLQLDTLGSQWKSDNVTATAQLLVDFGSAVDHDSFAFLGHNLVPGSDTVTLKYASNSAITTDVVTISHTLTANNWIEYFSSISRQYLEVLITKSLSTNQVYGGRLLSGEHYVTKHGLRPGYRIGPGQTMTTSVRTRGGQQYSSLGETMRVLRGTFPALADADRDELEALQKANSTGVPFVVSVDWENYPTRKFIYGTLTRVQDFQDVANGSWEWPLSMIEQE
jgi:hypothetical protein